MSLRARITLIITASFTLLAGVLLFEVYRREAAMESRLETAQLLTLRVSWAGFASTEEQRLLRHFEVLRRAPDVLASFASGTDQNLAQGTVALRSDIRATGFQALTPMGAVIYDSMNPQAPAVMTDDDVARILRSTQPVTGVVHHPLDGPVFAMAAPVLGTSGPVGVGVLWTSVPDMLDDLSASIALPSVLLEGREVVATGGVAAGANLGSSLGVSELAGHVRTLDQGGRSLQVTAIPVATLGGGSGLTLAVLRDVTEATTRRRLILAVSYLALGSAVILFAALINWSLRTSFQPLTAIVHSLAALTQGRTDLEVPVTQRQDEVGRLAGTFETFRQGMEAQARLERLAQELEVATRIQAQCLPKTFPQVAGVHFAAAMQPMREVGGDFYDVFDLPGQKIGFVVGDVSDKGVGAALFMAIARTAIRSIAQSADSAAHCVTQVNDYLCIDNDAMLFVTLIYGIYDPRTGTVDLCNAGHNPPIRFGVDAPPVFEENDPQIALAIIEAQDYAGQSISLKPGQTLFLYTDGVSEAMSLDEEEFGDARLLNTLKGASTAGASQAVQQVLDAVETFSAGADTNDDITCLAISIDPGPRT